MSSGKQEAFAYGEVSPSMNYRTGTNLYAQSLKKLYNGLVKKVGGVFNRPGTKYSFTPAYQRNITTANSPRVGVRTFPFYLSNAFFIIELQAQLHSDDSVVLKAYNSNGEEFVAFSVTRTSDSRVIGERYDLAKASFTQLNESITITVPRQIPSGAMDVKIFIITHSFSTFSYTSEFQKPVRIGTPTTTTATITCTGTTALLTYPVSYLITQELDDGSEVYWQAFNFDTCGPNIECQSKVTELDIKDHVGVKQYNIYRSAGVAGNHSSLVARVAPSSANLIFQDFLYQPDFTVQPPLDEYLYPPFGYIKKLFYYKGRSVMIYQPYRATGVASYTYTPGQFAVSKLGAPRMFGRPLTPNAVDAFSATIPTEKIGDITNYLVINRLLLFTKDLTILIRGGEAGILTPSSVNPEVIYHEGCSDEISPVASGTRGFFVTPDKSKLLMVKYGTDDTMSIVEISIYSDHLFEARDIRELAMVTGNENTLWILKMDGTLISLSISEEGTVQAFARHDTNGFIETMCSQEIFAHNYSKNSLDEYFTQRGYALILSVIRNGVRYYEQMAVRNDLVEEDYLYADSATVFGGPYTNKARAVNITTATTFAAGEVLTITDLLANNTLGVAYGFGTIMDISYPGENNIGTMKLRLTIIGVTNNNVITATAEEDVPAYLQNVQAQALSASEKLFRQQRYLRALNQVTGLTRLANQAVSVFAEGQVISSPWNPEQDTLIVDEFGVLTLPDHYTWGYVGLPYYFEMESLDLDASDARTFTDKGKLINSSGVAVNKTRGGLIGSRENNEEPTFEALTERETYGNTTSTETTTGVRNVPFPASWNMKGSLVIRQVDPLPISVLSIYPKGVIGD